MSQAAHQSTFASPSDGVTSTAPPGIMVTAEKLSEENLKMLQSPLGKIVVDAGAAAGGELAPYNAGRVGDVISAANIASDAWKKDYLSAAQETVDWATVTDTSYLGAALMPENPALSHAIGSAAGQAAITAGKEYIAPTVGEWMYDAAPSLFTP